MKRIVLATSNPGKAREIGAMLADLQIEVVPQSQFGTPEVEETGLTFIENALIKARAAAEASGLPALADDSGLEVDALGGEPGIRSARYAGNEGDDAANNAKLLEALADVPDEARTARFQCLLVLLRHATDPVPWIFQGTWEGRILRAPRGENGFGYDPLFFVPGQGCSAAELPPEVKNRLSHRGQALQQFIRRLRAEAPR
ncbi:MAG: XTP/dITP diphosphatase [Gammaproteobacteria bacterium]